MMMIPIYMRTFSIKFQRHIQSGIYELSPGCLNEKHDYGIGRVIMRQVASLENTLGAGPGRAGICRHI